jgi:serine/threonine-protein kinase
VDASLSVGTRAQTRMGTPRYMSPEQIESSHAVDPRSDVFSIGAILYEMLLGRVAFPGETATDVMYHVTRGNMNPAPELSAPLRAVVERALAVSPAARFESAAAFRDALAAVEKDAVVAPPPVVAASTAVPTTRPGTEPTFTSRQDPTVATPAPTLPTSAPPNPPRSHPTNLAWVLIPLGLAGLVGAAGLALGLSFLRSEVGADGGTPLSRDQVVPVEPTSVPVTPTVTPATPVRPDATPAAPDGPATPTTPDQPAPTPTTPDKPNAPGTPSAATAHGATPSSPPTARAAHPKPGPTDAQRIDAAWAKSRGAATTCTRGAKTVWKLSVAFAASGEPTKVTANASPRDATVAACLEGVGRKLRAGKLDNAGTRVFTLAP